MRRLLAILLAIGAVVQPISAPASMGPPVRVSMQGEPVFARPGLPFSGVFRVRADSTAHLSDFHFDGSGWQVLELDVPPDVYLNSGESLDVPFSLLTSDPENSPITLVCTLVDSAIGRDIRAPLDFSFRSYRKATQPGALLQLVWPDSSSGSSSKVHDDADRGTAAASTRNVNITGRVVYYRPDGVKVGADHISVDIREKDALTSRSLVSGHTDQDGYFDLSFTWDPSGLSENDPDIFFKLKTENAYVDVQHYIWDKTYTWESSVRQDYTGTGYNVELWPEEDDYPAYHILTTMRRIRRWFNTYTSYAPDAQVKVKWPYGKDRANFYFTASNTIHITASSEWSEATCAHEYGHHWQSLFAVQPLLPDYWNNVCDGEVSVLGVTIDPWPNSGHCSWCAESGQVALNEGFGDFLGWLIPSSFNQDYGVAALTANRLESPSTCQDGNGDPCDCDPWETEGFFAMLLRDIVDPVSSADDPDGDGRADASEIDVDEILRVMHDYEPETATEFIQDFRAAGHCLGFWETAYNDGYTGLDYDVPDPPTLDQASTSHILSEPSPDPTIDFQWIRAQDDCSGVAGYSVLISSDAPSLPDNVQDLSAELIQTYTTPVLSAGTYYLNVRSVDAAGHWGGSDSDGPYMIRDPIMTDLEFLNRSGWDYSVVATNGATATTTQAELPSVLQNSVSALFGTFFSVSYWNAGDDTAQTPRVDFHLDGEKFLEVTQLSLPGQTQRAILNEGPERIRGGLHTLGVRLDAADLTAEGDETNNEWARQWVWECEPLIAGQQTTHGAPPEPLGGTDWLPALPLRRWNCAGYRIETVPAEAVGQRKWNAVLTWASLDTDDYDCRLHAPNSGADDALAFGNMPIEWSGRDAGQIDAVFVSEGWSTQALYDIGVVNRNAGTGSFQIAHIAADSVWIGFQQTLTMNVDEMMIVGELHASAPLGAASVSVTVDPADGPIQVAWLEPGPATYSLGELSTVSTDASGHALLEVIGLSAGTHGIVLFRDPDDGRGSINFEVGINGGSANLGLETPPPGWAGNVVPRSSFDGTPESVPFPDSLQGNAIGTWINMAFRNTSPVAGDSVEGHVLVDGIEILTLPVNGVAGDTATTLNWPDPVFVRGGRHTLSAMVDDRVVPDQHPEDNRTGGQYVWSSLPVPAGPAVTRAAPPPLVGGWPDAASAGPLRFNCDGLRLPNLPGAWRTMAVMPGTGTNVDLRLHETFTGAGSGFGGGLAFSGWGPDQIDFVLVNTRATVPRPFDAGVLAGGNSTAPYLVQTAASVFGTPVPGGTLGPYSMSSGQLIRLHELDLPAGTFTLTLQDQSSTIDWGLSLHPADVPFASRSIVVGGRAASWLNGAGSDESIPVTLTSPGFCCLAVWKASPESVPLSGDYVISMSSVSTVPSGRDDPPTPVRLEAVEPNPFRTQVQISFATEVAGDVVLSIYGLRGQLVRRLVDGTRPAGRYDITWDGRDDAGRHLANGLYWVRLQAGRMRDTRKILLAR